MAMQIFKCKHKEYRVIQCNKKDKFYIVQCLKCGDQWRLPKAEGEEYDLFKIIKN